MKYEVLRPISVGGAVFQKGEVVELTEDVAKAHGKAYVRVVEQEEEETTDETVELSKLKLPELQALCDEKEIPYDKKAKKADLIALLEEAEEEEE